MNYIKSKNGLLDIKEGVIAHQVNCQDVIGGGLSGAIIKTYPDVEKAYHEKCKYITSNYGAEKLLGSILEVKVSDKLVVANVFSQFNYGNAYLNGKCYTDYNVLFEDLKFLCMKHKQVYIPKKIGCGLAGGDWDKLSEMIKDLPLTIVEKE